MTKCYIIESRYEYRTLEGVAWTRWFRVGGCKQTESEAKNEIKNIKSNFGDIDRKTKLKHEYRVSERS